MENGEITRQTLTLQLTEQVRRDILLGRLPSGSRVTVQSIADRYHVSAIPVRETMRTLAGEDLLIMEPYKGAVVRNIDAAFIEGLYDILRSMEVLIVESTVEHWDEALRQQSLAVNEQIAALTTREAIERDFNRLNRAFHDPLEQFSTNERARELRRYYHGCVSILVEKGDTHTPERVRQVVREHQAIVDAFDTHDMDAVRAAYDHHSLQAKLEFRRQLEAGR